MTGTLSVYRVAFSFFYLFSSLFPSLVVLLIDKREVHVDSATAAVAAPEALLTLITTAMAPYGHQALLNE